MPKRTGILCHVAKLAKHLGQRQNVATLFASVVLVGCTAGLPIPNCPAEGGPRWLELESDHFVMDTDLAEVAAEEALRDYERTYQIVEFAAFERHFPPTKRYRVIFLRSYAEFRTLGDPSGRAYVTRGLPNDLARERTILAHSDSREQALRVAAHEITHVLLARHFGSLPLWLNEGLAQYFGNHRLEGGKLVLGEGIPALYPEELPSVQQLLDADFGTFYPTRAEQPPSAQARTRELRMYVGAWLLVHMLMNTTDAARAEFTQYQLLLRSGKLPKDAWSAAFAHWEGVDIQLSFHEYAQAQRRLVWRLPYVQASQPEIRRERWLTDAEVHSLMARLLPWGRYPKEAAAQVEKAVRAAPHSREARLLRARFLRLGQPSEAERGLSELARSHPDDGEIAMELGLLYSSQLKKAPSDTGVRAKAEDAYRHLSAIAVTGDQLNEAAWYDWENHRPERGLALAERAVAADPLDPEILDTYAAILFDLGHIQKAFQFQQKAVALLPDQGERWRDVIKRWRKFREAALAESAQGGSAPAIDANPKPLETPPASSR